MPKSKPKKVTGKKPKPASAKAAKPAAKSVKKAPAKAKPAKLTKSAPKPAAKSAKKAPAKAVAKPAAKDAPKAATKLNGKPVPPKPVKITTFMKLQRERLRSLRDTMLDSMAGVAKDTLRTRAEGSEANAFGQHMADAGSDAYDKDFALSLLSQEQDALYEIEEAMKRIEGGTYGVCEMSGKPIPPARLEALPFARLTVQCQAEFERTKKFQRSRVPVTSLFGLTDSADEDGETEEAEEKPEKPTTEES